MINNWDQFNFFYADHFEVNLSDGHRFPMEKYYKLRQKMIQLNIVHSSQLFAAPLADSELLYLAHEKSYIDNTLALTLDPKVARKVGLPLTEEMINRARSSVMAFTMAVDSSLERGLSASLAGGTHHAHFNQGEGFCYFNDFAINVRRLYHKFPTHKILILDLDVHQGNGNSSILKNDPNVFIVSFHGKSNYPYHKIPSHIDVEFENNTEDEFYLYKLADTLKSLENYHFDHIFYQAGVDTHSDDKFGNLSLSFEGLKRRDQMVFKFAKKQQIPIAVAMGGGYAKNINNSIDAYINIFRSAKEIYTK